MNHTFEVYDVSRDVKLRLKGKYFNFINTNELVDLTRYQIGQNYEEHMSLNYEHCFIYALI